MNKDVLRKTYLWKRKTLNSHEKQKRETQMQKHFMTLLQQLPEIKRLHVFMPISKQNEPDTLSLIRELTNQNSNIEVVIPKTGEDGSLTHYLYSDKTKIIKNSWGIPEPENGEIVPEESLDLVVIPMIVFDKIGNRIGYGKGFYDRFLTKCTSNCIKIGYCITPPLDLIPFAESHDVPLDYAISPLGADHFIKL